MNEMEQDFPIPIDFLAVDSLIAKEVLKLKKKKIKAINQKRFDKLEDKICVKFNIDINHPANEDVEEKLLSALEKNGIKKETFNDLAKI